MILDYNLDQLFTPKKAVLGKWNALDWNAVRESDDSLLHQKGPFGSVVCKVRHESKSYAVFRRQKRPATTYMMRCSHVFHTQVFFMFPLSSTSFSSSRLLYFTTNTRGPTTGTMPSKRLEGSWIPLNEALRCAGSATSSFAREDREIFQRFFLCLPLLLPLPRFT